MAEQALSYRALVAVAALVRRITVANGFRTDIGSAVTVEVGFDVESGAVQANVAATGFEDYPEKSSRRVRAGAVLGAVEVAIPINAAGAGLLAHNALADLLEALPDSAIELPDNASTIAATGRQILRRPDGVNFIIAQVTFRTLLNERIPSPTR